MSIFSYNYLKGINLFEKTRTFKIVYTKVDGLAPSNPVTLNGYKIGKVQKINFNANNTKELIVDVVIENDGGYEGAIVLDPKPGIYLDDPIAVLDYASLYPSSIIP